MKLNSAFALEFSQSFVATFPSLLTYNVLHYLMQRLMLSDDVWGVQVRPPSGACVERDTPAGVPTVDGGGLDGRHATRGERDARQHRRAGHTHRQARTRGKRYFHL